MAVCRQRQRFRKALARVRRVQRLGSLHAAALPGQEGGVFVAIEGGHVVRNAGGDGVW